MRSTDKLDIKIKKNYSKNKQERRNEGTTIYEKIYQELIKLCKKSLWTQTENLNKLIKVLLNKTFIKKINR